MITKAVCLRNIKRVRVSASDPQAAYLIRTRLRRALLSCVTRAAQLAGRTPPLLPGTYPVLGPPEARNLIALCNTIHTSTVRLCQPSEALDQRWESAWRELSKQLDLLERLVEQT